ncbi:hypothetical protein GGI07_002255 [Coemansia sp. Benny D115]|nr:hypothetical protein GGI07_002255 [Coemansia sp. Benny D115]
MQPLLAIVRHSASTLRVLEINSLAAAEIPALFTDRAHQTAISYPQLKTFIVGQYPIFGRPTSELMAEIPGYKRFIPFPNLRRLCVNGCYAFDNDLLLRSNNGGTLERLSLPIDQCFTEMAAKQQIFREKMFSNLASISLTIGGREFPVTARLKADAACLALDVVAASKDASVEHLKLDGLFNSSVLIQGISQRVDGFLGIKVLELPKMRLDFAEIADILGQLQMLRRLRCALSGKASNMLDESIDVNSDKNASESCKAWCAGAGRVLNPNFESLQLTPTTKCSMGVIALWLSFLYTVCPRLHRVGMGMVDLKNACKDAVC